MRRYADRIPDRHPVHLDSARSEAVAGFAKSAQPVGLGPVITVDTTQPVDIQMIAAEVRRLLSARQPAASCEGEPVPA